MTATPLTAAGADALDNPAWSALTGAHAQFAVGSGDALRYRPEVSPIIALRDQHDPRSWADLAALVGAGVQVTLAGVSAEPPAGWERVGAFQGVQMVATDRLRSAPDADALRLGADDALEMLALVRRTEPGPFEPETYRLGTYLGFRVAGELVAMAGERLHADGFTEISAVCTDSRFRGRGYASRLVKAVAHEIRERGDTPFLHASAANTGAIRLYEALGFEHRADRTFLVVRTPGPLA